MVASTATADIIVVLLNLKLDRLHATAIWI
jgi:hypothetical protein